MARQKNPERTSPVSLEKERLRAAIRVLQEGTAPDDARAGALATLRALGEKARVALLLIVAALNDRAEANRFQAFQIFHDLCADAAGLILALGQALASPDEQVRLDAIRQIIRIVPDVQEARAKDAPGWPGLRELIRRERPAQEGPMPRPQQKAETETPEAQGAAKNHPTMTGQGKEGRVPLTIPSPPSLGTLDDATFYEFLPTAVHDPDDPVVRAMRANPGRWLVWNEATRAVLALADDYNEAVRHVGNPDDPNVKLDLAPGLHPAAPVHRPLELLPWESPDVLDDVQLLWGDSAAAWLDCPNPQFGGRKPRELAGTDAELYLRELLRAVRYGATS